MNDSRFFTKLSVLYFACCLLVNAGEHQWSNWRGPFQNGSSDATGLSSRWNGRDDVLWKVDLPGTGASTPVMWGNKLFLTAEATENRDLMAFCIDRVTGKIVWDLKLGQGQKLMRNNMASPSATVDGERVYFMFGNGVLHAVDFDGKILWQRDFDKDYGPSDIKFGFSATPLVFNGKIYVTVMRLDRNDPRAKQDGSLAKGHYLAALDTQSGKTIWKHDRPVSADDESQQAYSSPILMQSSRGPQILLLGGDCLTAHDPETGDEIWRWSGYNEKNSLRHRVITSPLAVEDSVIVCEPRHKAVYALRSSGKGNLEDGDFLWKYDGGTDSTTPLYYDGLLYVLDGDRKRLMVLDPASGKELWRSQLPSEQVYRASPVGADGKVYCLGGDGKVTVFKAGREREELATMEMGGTRCRSTIAISDGCLYIRTSEALYCIGK
jgi:outer membrane protein assembly factor BamB